MSQNLDIARDRMQEAMASVLLDTVKASNEGKSEKLLDIIDAINEATELINGY